VEQDLSEIKKIYHSAQKRGTVLYAETCVSPPGSSQDTHLWITASPLIDKNGTAAGAIESIRDISERIKTEHELKYLSLHDQLTGLCNRTYFEAEIHRLDIGRCMMVGIIIFDLDGLKVVNDTLGHATGDSLLRAAANVIKSIFRKEDMVARIGGDEFAAIVPHGGGSILEIITNRFQDALHKYNAQNPPIPLSISLGWAFRKEKEMPLKDVFEEADNNMYKEKLHHSQSTRSTIVQALMTTLNVRDFITEGHADRLKALVMELGERIGFSHQRISNLILFAQFHDIGKIGVPDSVLLKPGKLNAEERIIMQRHSEIGSQIACSSRELTHISDWILKHHEAWDGRGYPQGISGEEIPIECRILAIADAYDAMTSDRPYRKAMPQELAIHELRRCAGTQFDPVLVEKFIDIVTSRVAS